MGADFDIGAFEDGDCPDIDKMEADGQLASSQLNVDESILKGAVPQLDQAQEGRRHIVLLDMIRDVIRSAGQQTVQMAVREEPESFNAATKALLMSLFE